MIVRGGRLAKLRARDASRRPPSGAQLSRRPDGLQQDLVGISRRSAGAPANRNKSIIWNGGKTTPVPSARRHKTVAQWELRAEERRQELVPLSACMKKQVASVVDNEEISAFGSAEPTAAGSVSQGGGASLKAAPAALVIAGSIHHPRGLGSLRIAR